MSDMRKLMKLMEADFTDPVQNSSSMDDVINQLKDLKSRLEAEGAPEEAIRGMIATQIQQLANAIFQEIMSGEEYDSRIHGGNAPTSNAIN